MENTRLTLPLFLRKCDPEMTDDEIRNDPLNILVMLNACEEWAIQAEKYSEANDTRASQCAAVYQEAVNCSVEDRVELRKRVVAFAIDKYPRLKLREKSLLTPNLSE